MLEMLWIVYYAFLTVGVVGTSKSVQDDIFLRAVRRKAEVKGIPFPKIAGPSHQNKVCIVGAGPAGIHLAVELKNRNFTDIVIFEKDRRG